MRFFNTFRGRLLLILAVLLVATISLQYYLNLRTQRENEDLRDAQAQALFSGFAVASIGLTSGEYMQDLINRSGQTLFDDAAREKVRDVLIIDNNWQITDSLNPDFLPTGDNGEIIYKKLSDLPDLPPLIEGERLGGDLANFPNRIATTNRTNDDEAHVIPIETSKGRWFIMILLKNDRSAATWRAARPLVFTVGILLLSSLTTFFLVWRFSRPIADLSHAARQVADGNLHVRVPQTRNDELGRLAANFNVMTSELEKSRDLEAQLQQSEKSAVVGRLGSAIAHEIRNPLNYINLTLDHLRSKYSPAETEKRAAFEKLTSQLKDEVARINRQISDFLNYSRPAKADLKPVAARSVIDDSLRMAEIEAAEKGVTIGIIEHEDVPEVMGDPEYLRSVFNNLFINALQAMENTGGHLTVKITHDDGSEYVNYEVSDTGNGIADENLSNIFEPYFSTKETGTGLGLAIVQKIVDIHKGSIDVESTIGEGTKFTVKLPRAEN